MQARVASHSALHSADTSAKFSQLWFFEKHLERRSGKALTHLDVAEELKVGG